MQVWSKHFSMSDPDYKVEIWQKIEDICRAEGYSDAQLSEGDGIWSFKGNSTLKTRVVSLQLLKLEKALLKLNWKKQQQESRRQAYLMILLAICHLTIPALAQHLERTVEITASGLWSTVLSISSIYNKLYFTAFGVGSLYFLLCHFIDKQLDTLLATRFLRIASVFGVMAIAIQASLLLNQL